MEFTHLNELLVENFNKMTKGATHLFAVDLDLETLWNLYLDSFPPGANEIFRERREFDCSCCRQYVKTIGNAVVIKDNKVYTIWGLETGDEVYQPVLDALDNYVKSKVVSNIWLGESQKVGTLKNFEPVEGGKTIQWDHFYLELPKHFVNDKDATKKSTAETIAPFRDARNVFKRGLDELTQDSLLTVLELIAQNSLYKGEESKFILTEFLKHKKAYDKLQTEEEKSNYTWEQSVKVSGAISKIRNTSIGSLLVEISENMDLDIAVRRYEKMVAPENYKRSKPIYSKKMLEDARNTVKELGYETAIPRRHAKLDDITINNILFADKDAAGRIVGGDIFDEMLSEVAVNPRKFSKVDEVASEHFFKEILPKAQGLELFVENRHTPNFVSVIAPVHTDSKSMFKWDNGFSWAYAGNITDSSMKELVKSAGGRVDGVLRFSIQWNDTEYDGNDLDAHCLEPDNYRIYFHNKGELSPSGGKLDVDIRTPRRGTPAVENITWATKATMKKGTYKMLVHNYSHNGGRSGFRCEIEGDGQIHSFNYNKEVPQGKYVEVAEVYFDGENFTIKDKLPSNVSSKETWGVKTNQFVPVTVAMLSPNYWDEQQGIGHKHYFFMLKDCVNPENPNGFYNEFLKEELMKHRRVFEALGGKAAVQESEDQLSGLGFSSTKRNDVLIKVKGQSERVLKVKF